MPTNMICSCGNGLIIPERHAGRQLTCPRCRKTITVPASFTPAVPRGAKGSGAGGGALRVVVLLLALVVLVGAAGVGIWMYTSNLGGPTGDDGPEVSDRALLPGNVQMVATIRLAELYQMPAAKDAIEQARRADPKQEDPAARMERETGLKPEEIDRLHVVGLDADKQSGWVVARTLAPVDRKNVLGKLTKRIDKRHAERRYYVGKAGESEDVAVHIAGPNVVVLSNEEGMKRAMEQASKPVTDGPLKPTIALGATSKAQVIVGLNPGAGGMDAVRNDANMKAVAEVKQGRLTLEANDKEATLQMIAEMSDEKSAMATRLALGGQLTLLQIGLAFQDANAKKVAQLIGAMKIEVKGKEIHATTKGDPATVAGAMMYLGGLAAGKK